MLTETEHSGMTASNNLAQGNWVAEVSRGEERGQSFRRGSEKPGVEGCGGRAWTLGLLKASVGSVLGMSRRGDHRGLQGRGQTRPALASGVEEEACVRWASMAGCWAGA